MSYKGSGKKSGVEQAVLSLKVLFGRLSFFLLILCAVIAIVVSRTDSGVAENIRTKVMDVTVPLLAVLSSPIQAYGNAKEAVSHYFAVYEENAVLRQENIRLRRIQEVALALESENRRLRGLLKVAPAQELHYVTARIVGEVGGPYMKSALINAGAHDGVAKGQAVVESRGLAGRIIEVGSRSARVLLITDMGSRIPVVSQDTGERLIVAGNNSQMMTVLHAPSKTRVKAGEVLTTSGDGGLFPQGVPVGVVASVSEEGIEVKPFVSWSYLDMVHVVNYRLDQKKVPQDIE